MALAVTLPAKTVLRTDPGDGDSSNSERPTTWRPSSASIPSDLSASLTATRLTYISVIPNRLRLVRGLKVLVVRVQGHLRATVAPPR